MVLRPPSKKYYAICGDALAGGVSGVSVCECLLFDTLPKLKGKVKQVEYSSN